MKNWRVFLCLTAILFLLAGCGKLFGNTVGSGDISGQPALTDADFPDVSPCSDRDTMPSDSDFLSTVTDATEIIHIHKQYISDLNLPAVCGLGAEDNALQDEEIGWDPTLGTDMYACDSFSETIGYFLDSTDYSPGICRSGFGYDKTDNDRDGFPRGGNYHYDICVNYEEKSYMARILATVSGDDADKTWESAGIDENTPLELYNSDGILLSSMEDAKGLVTNNPGGTVFTIRSGDGATTHLSVGLQIICVKSVEECPTADEDNECN